MALIGFPLAYVGHYAGLRYRLSRTRWRGIRCGMAGSAWRYGAIATFLTFANAMTGQLLTPVVSVNLARPRISNARVGTLPFAFAGRAGDIYGRYLGYYFLNILAWLVAAGIVVRRDRRHASSSWASSSDDFLKLFSQPSLRTILIDRRHRGRRLYRVQPADPAAALLVAGLSASATSCRTRRAGNVLFATAITTRQMWGFLVLNYLIVAADPRHRLAVGHAPHAAADRRASSGSTARPTAPRSRQPPDRGPRFGEGLLDMFDVSGV